MTRIAIHPTTLELREFKPGQGLVAEGYVVVKDAADLVDKGKTFFDELAERIMERKPNGRNRLTLATKLWPDIVIRALHNQQLKPLEDSKRSEKPTKPAEKGVGRGNHKTRLPEFELTGVKPSIRLPTQCEVLCLELNKLHMAGWRKVTVKQIKPLVEGMKLPTQQDPMRIFRYYFWLCVRAGTLKVEGPITVDQVVKQNADRHGFEPMFGTSEGLVITSGAGI